MSDECLIPDPKRFGRRFIGIELDREHFLTASCHVESTRNAGAGI
jgi:hypothetical protein